MLLDLVKTKNKLYSKVNLLLLLKLQVKTETSIMLTYTLCVQASLMNFVDFTEDDN